MMGKIKTGLKAFSVFIVLLMFLVMVSACGSDQPTPSTIAGTPGGTAAPAQTAVKTAATTTAASGRLTTAAASAPADNRVVLELWTGGWKNNSTYEAFVNSVLDDYNKLHPEVTVDWHDFGNDTLNRLDKILTGKDTTNLAPPDLVLLAPTDFYQYANLGLLEPLNDYGEFSSHRQEYTVASIDAYKVGANNYGIPWLASTRLMVINKKLWQVAGLDTAKLPATFDDFETLYQPLTKKTPEDVRAIWLKPEPVKDFIMEDLPLFQQGAEGKFSAAFNNPVTQARWNYYQMRLADFSLVKEALEGTDQDILNRFSREKMVVWMNGAEGLSALKEANPDLYNQNLLLGLYPTSKSGLLPYLSKGAWAIPKLAHNKGKAIDFAAFIANDKNQLTIAKITPPYTYVPTAVKAYSDPFINGTGDAITQARGLISATLQNGLVRSPEKALPYPTSAETRAKLLAALNDAQRKLWVNGTPSDQALGEAVKAWNAALNQ